MPQDRDFSERTRDLVALGAVLDGTQYDHIAYAFSEETNGSNEYVPLDQRRPSIKTNLCRIVVDDAVSLLFSEGHFPSVQAKDQNTADALNRIIKARQLNSVMIEAATLGSVGSVAILMRVLKRKLFFSVLPTAYLMPEWLADDPGTLKSVRERYKVAPADLIERGYDVDPKGGLHWFQRVWDDNAETWFQPWPVRGTPKDFEPKVDEKRTVTHALGFCPFVWIKNLPGGEGVDGACTFKPAIDTVIEGDYQMSQAGRGLKYSSDPTLVLKDMAAGTGAAPQRTGGAARMLSIQPESDAKLLEINGTAAQAVLEHFKALRVLVLEIIHGNRTDADRLSAASSGRAMELMNQSLVWLADRMKITYAEGGLLALLRMICRASAAVKDGLIICADGDDASTAEVVENLDLAGISLRWPPWYAPTHTDKQALTTALKVAVGGGILSRETAVSVLAPLYDIEDVQAELTKILADQKAEDARVKSQAATVTANENVPE
ncbi:phage portal protein [Acidocella aminolytica]|nr:phage portal protein [Acidocella aminolytica]